MRPPWRAALALAAGCAAGKGRPDDSAAADPAAAAFAAWCPADAAAVEAAAAATLAGMSLDEKIAQMAGAATLPDEAGLYPTPDDPVHGIPGFRMVDGPRGAHEATGPATAFPVGIARGATFSPALEAEVGAAIAQEVAAVGADVLLAPTINVLRHPRWGRSQETYGEDPHHLGVLGAAFVTGAQRHVLAQPKHLTANSIEDTRFDVDVALSESALHEVYLPQFEAVLVGAGAATVMSAYNGVNGAPASESAPLLTGVLRDQWHWPGIVVSDWIWATETTAGALNAGLDIEMPRAVVFGDALKEAILDGSLDEAKVDAAVTRILHTKGCFADRLAGAAPVDPAVRRSPAHLALAQTVAERSAVLLEERGALPLEDGLRIAVGGRLADVENIGDQGSSRVLDPAVVTAWAGLQAAAADHDWTVVAADDAGLAQADAVVLVVGLTDEDEGEGFIAAGDRTGLGLGPEDEAAIAAALAQSDRVVVVMQGGGAITVGDWADEVGALVMAWYPGGQGGHALARLLAGTVPFAGRMPVTVPVDEADLPPFDNTSLAVTYDHWHGYRHLDRTGTAARYPFGFGRSLTTFAVGAPTVRPQADGWEVAVTVENTGDRPGIETVQLYAGPAEPRDDRPPRELVAFAQAALAPGARETLRMAVDRHQLATWENGGWVAAAGPQQLWVATSAAEVQHAATME